MTSEDAVPAPVPHPDPPVEAAAQPPSKKLKTVLTSALKIITVALKEEYVTIVNTGAEAQDLTGYELRSATGKQTYKFPEGLVVAGGATLNIWSGKHSEAKHKPPTSLFWSARYIWNDNGDSAQLVDATGTVIAQKDEIVAEVKKPVRIEVLDLIDEFLVISNHADEDVDVGGYFIKSLTGKQVFYFPTPTVIPNGGAITVWSGPESDVKGAASNAVSWTKRNIWNNSGDIAVLYNAAGDLVDFKAEYPLFIQKKVAPP